MSHYSKIYVVGVSYFGNCEVPTSDIAAFTSFKKAKKFTQNPAVEKFFDAKYNNTKIDAWLEIHELLVDAEVDDIVKNSIENSDEDESKDIQDGYRDLGKLNGLTYEKAKENLQLWHKGIDIEKTRKPNRLKEEDYVFNNVRVLVDKKDIVIGAVYH